MHKPVLLHETIQILNPQEGECFIDGTLGGGGHAREIAKRLGKEGTLIALDWDNDAVIRFKARADELTSKTIVLQRNYADIPDLIAEKKIPQPQGILVDLGFSSDQIEAAERGFSFREDGPLDMRYAREEGIMTAAEVVNGYKEDELAQIFKEYGEESFARVIAAHIIGARKKQRIMTTHALAEIIERAIPAKYHHERIHPATKVFQALRIFVNREFENIEKLLLHIDECLEEGGRVGIISFHSLEDRIVKRAFQKLVKEGKGTLLTKKPIIPSEEEEKENPRSRSAKLRAFLRT
ncbi:MAG: 16S rRNA (cytosine(1402)-N(4))-methyltransferase RsmH [Candidatus Paceibacterota bacterium]|jgi:16S rRNA (cytosine1402-N4)-methyltransferase